MRQNHPLVFQLYAKKPAWELLQHRTGYFYTVLFAHKPPEVRWAGQRRYLPVRIPARDCRLCRRDVSGLQALGTLCHFELHPGAFIQGAISLRLDRREVNEDVFPVLPLDKAISLGCVKPLHCSFFFHLPIFLLKRITEPHRTPACNKAAPDNKKGAAEWTHAAPSRNYVRSGKQESNALPLYNRSALRPPAT